MQLTAPPALETLKSTRKQMGPANTGCPNGKTKQHISQDKSPSRATTAGHKGYRKPGKEKNVQVIISSAS